MSPWGWPRGLVHNLQIQRNTRFLRTRFYVQERPSSIGVLQPYFKSSKGISRTSLRQGILNKIHHWLFSYDLLKVRKRRNDYQQATYEDNFSHVLNQEFFFWFRSSSFASNPTRLEYWLLRPFFYKEATCKGSTEKGLPYPAKAVPSKDYLRTWPWQSQERDAEWSAPTIARHIHGASELLGT